jgi:hypothetical protein
LIVLSAISTPSPFNSELQGTRTSLSDQASSRARHRSM